MHINLPNPVNHGDAAATGGRRLRQAMRLAITGAAVLLPRTRFCGIAGGKANTSYLRLSRAAPGHRFQSSRCSPGSFRMQDLLHGRQPTGSRWQASRPLLNSGKPDVWDSGRVASDKSFGVVYGGPELAASTRYYWRVEVWDKDGKPYPRKRRELVGNRIAQGKLESPVDRLRRPGAPRGPQIRRYVDHQCGRR